MSFSTFNLISRLTDFLFAALLVLYILFSPSKPCKFLSRFKFMVVFWSKPDSCVWFSYLKDSLNPVEKESPPHLRTWWNDIPLHIHNAIHRTNTCSLCYQLKVMFRPNMVIWIFRFYSCRDSMMWRVESFSLVCYEKHNLFSQNKPQKSFEGSWI